MFDKLEENHKPDGQGLINEKQKLRHTRSVMSFKMHLLFKQNSSLKNKMSVPVDENNYYQLAKFWIENRDHYINSDGIHNRNSDSSYNQDHEPVLEQTTIEGHVII